MSCWLFVGPQSSFAQTATLSLNGSVQSPERRGVAQAAVTVVHLPSGIRRAAATDAEGNFTVPNLFVGGPYVVQVSQPGYRVQMANNIFLAADQPSRLSFTLVRQSAAGKEAAVPAPARSTPGSPAANAAPATAATPAPPADLTAAASAVAPAPAASRRAAADEPPIVDHRAYVPRPERKPAKGAAPLVSGHYDAKSGNYIYDTGAPVTIKLPGGELIRNVGGNSTESQLHRFITDPAQQVDTVDLTRGWLNFDRVYFEPGKATLTPESVQQLRHVAQLLRAYPKVHIKLGGYTDSTGTYKVNKQLSEARARTAWATLVELGVGASRMDARGYGPRYAIASNVSDEGRAMNRRLSIKVLEK
jgi:outer membrane protein OmpA-like peptidoglycan-associated protein